MPPGEKRIKYHVPLAGDIAATSADLLFSRQPVITAADKGTQAAIDRLAGDDLHATLLEAAELCSALGGVFLRTVWDTQVSDRPWIDKVPADAAVPTFSYNRLTAVTFWRVLGDSAGDVIRHLETHVPGQNRIEHRVYVGDQSDLGTVYPLSDFPETAQFAQYLTDGDSITFPDQPKDASTVVYVPNMRPNRLWRDLGPQAEPLGRSDYQGSESLLDGLDEVWCSDVETEILSDHGWLGYQDLRAGDRVLTLNHETGLSEWQPVIEVCVFPSASREMVSIESRSHSSLTTPDHRWPVIKARGRDRRKMRQWATSAELTGHDEITASAPCVDVPQEAKWSDEFVALAAWTYTEGTVRPYGGIVLSQSERSNPVAVLDIRRILRSVFGPPSATCRDTAPRWRESDNYAPGDETVSWHLNKAAAAVICQVFTGNVRSKIVSLDFVRSLTWAQLRLFVDESMRADGTVKANGWEMYQKEERRLDAPELAAILLGLTPRRSGPNDRGHYRLGVSQPSSYYAKASDRRTVTYDGVVWCPRTDNQTWLARRHGTVYFTGNTSWMRDIQLGKARLIVPQGYLDSIGRGKGAVFDPDRAVYSPVASLGGSGAADITQNQFKIRWQEHMQTVQKTIGEIVRRAGYSSQDFGEEPEAVAMTATEIEARERRSLITRDKKVLYWRPALRDALYGLLSVQRTMFGDSSVIPERPEVNFAEVVIPDRLEVAQTVAALAGAEAASKQVLVQMVHPDWTEAEVDEEVQLIRTEIGLDVLGRARISLMGPQAEPLGEDIADIAGLTPAAPLPADVPGEREDLGGGETPGA